MAEADSPLIAPSSANAANPIAQDVVRGISRLFARNDIWCLPEMPLRCGRRADLMGIDAKGKVVIVEVKTARGHAPPQPANTVGRTAAGQSTCLEQIQVRP